MTTGRRQEGIKLREHPSLNFGLVIAFVAPGAVALSAVALFVPVVASWFGRAATGDASVGGFLFVSLGSLAVGVFVSGLRWVVLDELVFGKWLKFKRPPFDTSRLANPGCFQAFAFIVENRYRYYQFYSNALIALVTAVGAWFFDRGLRPWERPAILVLVLVTSAVLFLSAKDSLKNYYDDVEKLLSGGV